MKEVKKVDRKTIVRRRRNIVGTISGILGCSGAALLVFSENGVKYGGASLRDAFISIAVGSVLIGLGLVGAWILDATR